MKQIIILFINGILLSQQYVLTKGTFSNLGGVTSSANYILKSAVGQSVTGESKNDYIEQAGFYTYSKLREIKLDNKPSLIPKVFSLYQPYPNPAINTVVIKYGVPKIAHINIAVYDITGRLVALLVNTKRKPGFYKLKWCIKDSFLPQGVYFLRLTATGFTATKKLILLK